MPSPATRPTTIARQQLEWLVDFAERKGIDIGGMALGDGSAAVWVPGAGGAQDMVDDFTKWQREQEKRTQDQ